MISRIVFLLILVLGLTAKADLPEFTCNYNVQGGDYFPWSNDGSVKFSPLPFPWNDIQGIWRLSSDSKIYLKARVINSTNNRKLLNIALMSIDSCMKPVAGGTGYVDSAEKEVVRAILTDGTYRYQLRLGMFDSKQLKIDANTCGQNVLAATFKVLGTTPSASFRDVPKEAPVRNMMLKKISSNLNAICK